MKYCVKLHLINTCRYTIEAESKEEAEGIARGRFDEEFGEGATDELVSFALIFPAEPKAEKSATPGK